MVVSKAGPPHWSLEEGLEGAGNVDKGVAHKEEHTEKGSDGVHITNQHSNLRVEAGKACTGNKGKKCTSSHMEIMPQLS